MKKRYKALIAVLCVLTALGNLLAVGLAVAMTFVFASPLLFVGEMYLNEKLFEWFPRYLIEEYDDGSILYRETAHEYAHRLYGDVAAAYVGGVDNTTQFGFLYNYDESTAEKEGLRGLRRELSPACSVERYAFSPDGCVVWQLRDEAGYHACLTRDGQRFGLADDEALRRFLTARGLTLSRWYRKGRPAE